MGAEVCSLAQGRVRLDVDEHRSNIAVAHQCKPQSFNAVVGMKTVCNGAGAEVVGYDGNVLILGIVYHLGPVIARLEPGVLSKSVEAVELVEYLDQGGVTCAIIRLLVMPGHGTIEKR